MSDEKNATSTKRPYAYVLRLTKEERQAARRAAGAAGADMATYFRHLLRKDTGLPTLGIPVQGGEHVAG